MDENFQQKDAPTDFPWVENELPAVLGVPLSLLARYRTQGLLEGIHFVRHRRRVCLSNQALALLRHALKLETPKNPPPPPPPTVRLKTTPHKTLNPHIIMACLLDDEKAVMRVRVKSKENFRAWMVIEARHLGADLYELVGNCPRFPGKF